MNHDLGLALNRAGLYTPLLARRFEAWFRSLGQEKALVALAKIKDQARAYG